MSQKSQYFEQRGFLVRRGLIAASAFFIYNTILTLTLILDSLNHKLHRLVNGNNGRSTLTKLMDAKKCLTIRTWQLHG